MTQSTPRGRRAGAAQAGRFGALVVAASALAGLALVAPAAAAPAPHWTPSAGGWRPVHGWPQLPDNEMLDQVSAVAVDREGDVLVLTRAGREWPETGPFDTTPIAKPTVLVFDGRTGRLKSRWGAGLFALPHSITVDAHDQVWVSDVALHQVFKLSHDGKLLLALGERAKPGEDERHFNEPAGVAVGPDGSVFVADGYVNSRVVKFDRSGAFVRAWGGKGRGPGQFDLAHGVAVDAQGRVFVVDRRNKRIQAFDGDGRFLFQLPGPPFASPQAIATAPSGRLYVAESGSVEPPDRTGVLELDAAGALKARIGRYGNYDGQFVDLHWVAVDRKGAVYAADFEGKRVQKFVRRP